MVVGSNSKAFKGRWSEPIDGSAWRSARRMPPTRTWSMGMPRGPIVAGNVDGKSANVAVRVIFRKAWNAGV